MTVLSNNLIMHTIHTGVEKFKDRCSLEVSNASLLLCAVHRLVCSLRIESSCHWQVTDCIGCLIGRGRCQLIEVLPISQTSLSVGESAVVIPADIRLNNRVNKRNDFSGERLGLQTNFLHFNVWLCFVGHIQSNYVIYFTPLGGNVSDDYMDFRAGAGFMNRRSSGTPT